MTSPKAFDKFMRLLSTTLILLSGDSNASKPMHFILFLDDQKLSCGSGNVKCHCDQERPENESAKMTKRRRNYRVTCSLCTKTFADNRNLKNHIDVIHNQVKAPSVRRIPTVQSPICQKLVTSKSSLTKHIKYVHQRIRPFKCDICEATFSEKAKYER